MNECIGYGIEPHETEAELSLEFLCPECLARLEADHRAGGMRYGWRPTAKAEAEWVNDE